MLGDQILPNSVGFLFFFSIELADQPSFQGDFWA